MVMCWMIALCRNNKNMNDDDDNGLNLSVSAILNQTAMDVDAIVRGYTNVYKEIFAHTEGVLQRSIDTGNTTAATVSILQMYNTIDTSWRVVDTKLQEAHFKNNSVQQNVNLGQLVTLLAQNTTHRASLDATLSDEDNDRRDTLVSSPHSSINRLRNVLQQNSSLVTSIVDKYNNRGAIALRTAVEQSTPQQRRLFETTLFQSAFCPDVSSMTDFHHPNSTVYDTSLDHSWCPRLVPLMQNITFFATTILRELVHDENTHETHMLFTVLHIMQRMGFYPDDICQLALPIDTLFYGSIIADTQFHFIAQNSPNLYTFPGDNLFNIMCVFVDSGCCTLFANSSAAGNKKRTDWWGTKYVKSQAERALNDIRRATAGDKSLMRYSILHGLQHLRNSTFDKLKRVSTLQHIILGSPLPYAKMVLEVQQLFMSGLAQIPDLGSDITSYIESNTCFRVRGWPLVMRQHYVMFIKGILWQLKCIPATPAVFWASGVFNPLHSPRDIVKALISWHNSNPFNRGNFASDDEIESLLMPFVKHWSQYTPKTRVWKWEVEECEVQKEVSLRLGRNDCVRDHEALLHQFDNIMGCLLRVNKAHRDRIHDDNRRHHYGFNPAEIIANLSESECDADHQRKAARELNCILNDFDVEQSTLNFLTGVASLRPRSVFGEDKSS